ncbi:hypothetical protein N7504_002583 [Penicillium tannophilum]|nr:hypothetical protein N7504_002583 [Penicillium tannophilum]
MIKITILVLALVPRSSLLSALYGANEVIQIQASPVCFLLCVKRDHVMFVAPLRPLKPKCYVAESALIQVLTLQIVEHVGKWYVPYGRRLTWSDLTHTALSAEGWKFVYLACVKKRSSNAYLLEGNLNIETGFYDWFQGFGSIYSAGGWFSLYFYANAKAFCWVIVQ